MLPKATLARTRIHSQEEVFRPQEDKPVLETQESVERIQLQVEEVSSQGQMLLLVCQAI